MNQITRRKIIQGLGLSSVLGLSGCEDECTLSDLIVVAFMFLIIGASSQLAVLRAQIRRRMNGERDAGEVLSLDEIVAGTGAAYDFITGPDPTPNAPAGSRAVYILDSLGDQNSDGRVIAITSSPTTFAVRGSVNLRNVPPTAPFGDLRDAALSPDGRTMVVCQGVDPPQWIFINTVSMTVMGTVALPSGFRPRISIFSADGKLVYCLVAPLESVPAPQPPNSI